MAVLLISGCGRFTQTALQAGRQAALTFIKSEATYRYDGIPETLEEKEVSAVGNGWQFTYQFDSRNAGYGDRTGQALAEVITPHSAVIMIEDGKVISAVMDKTWDMISQQLKIEIKPAPIDEVTIQILKSNPPQINVHIKGGLPDGCSSFHNMAIDRQGETINIKVSIQRPMGMSCPAIYTTFEKDVNLGTDFKIGTTYTLNVNDYSTTFGGTS